ncbi:SH3 domain-containing protein [uncultured Kordia sp.]|uniref:SH3 domain-containing protein n=1 Tax=uncultured Kordia sp. TaxID=507699 RepID=UPI00260EBF2A|nr:SH3 domain-containing protein [uncultured Kordia sp.]
MKVKIHSTILKINILFLVFLFISCGSDTSKKETPETNTDTTSKTEATTEKEDNNTYYVWVDNINVRKTPNTKGKVIGTYKPQEIKFTGTISENKDIIVLRSVVYDDYWLKVTTKGNKKGWVYGGAVKNEGDDIGNEIITDEQFDFIHFGKFDLTTWKNISIKNEEAGDAETQITTYHKDGKILEISKSEFGEYGYEYRYVLKDSKHNILKEREFYFMVDGGAYENRVMELIEIVKDYTNKVQYTRSQKTSKHFMQMNAKPLMVNGVWESVLLSTENKTESEVDKKTAFAKPLQVITTLNDLPDGFAVDDGCSCTFRTHPKDYGTMVFIGTTDDPPKAIAVIKIDGKYISLKSKKPENTDDKRGSVHKQYYNEIYDLKLTLTEEAKDNGGGTIYSGTMHLTSKDGTIDTNINTFGSCGC